MATIVLSAAGAALGGSIGGNLLGLSMTAVGRFVGASVGRALDQRLMGQGSETVETGRVDRFRLTGAGEGAPLGQVYGRMRTGGHVIWATEFTERVSTSGGGGGGKGAPRQPRVKSYSYTVSIALALCEGEIAGVGRVWADGAELAVDDLVMRVYPGSLDQLPDPLIEAVEGAGEVPAYRGTAYVVLEDLPLEQFGNRVPQFSFEVKRPVQAGAGDDAVPHAVQGVALMPGSGEYALATTPVTFDYGGGSARIANVNTPSGRSDLETSLAMLNDEAPNCEAVSLIVSWFGGDLRVGECRLQPKVEQKLFEGNMAWSVSGIDRETAAEITQQNDRPIYGGTPTDASVVESIVHMHELGKSVMFYPFILMDQDVGNELPNPYTGEDTQPALPWRGRITLSVAPGVEGTPDGTAAADAEVAAFMGVAQARDFTVGDGVVSYSGPQELSYRRFILHYAALCAAAGGVDSFCIGSEMRGLTQIRGANGFPAVDAMRSIAAEVRTLLPEAKIGYAADWSEYFGYHPGDGDVFFHLDPLWADDAIDFIGIDNYMPLSDWRDGDDHVDAVWGSIYDLDYLTTNVAGGEGFEWYYDTPEAEAAQRRVPIEDGAHDEPWVYRYKDIKGWWSNAHHERIDGVRAAQPTAWVPGSKPVWFTEIGCAAIDKGTNQPNKFLDPKSSESFLPKYSDGRRDELIQRRYLEATYGFWNDPANNPVSNEYGGPMVDMSRAFVWAWDARPYPWFPGNMELWSDGLNYTRGHWITGRLSGRALSDVVTEICARVGLHHVDTSRLFGFVRGYVVPDVSDARSALQPLMLGYGFDAIERDGVLIFRMRDGLFASDVDPDRVAVAKEIDGRIEHQRGPEAETAGRVRLRFVEADGAFQSVAEEAVLPDDKTHSVAETELPLSLTRAEGRLTAERWLSEARVARDAVRLALPPSRMDIGAGDVIRLPEGTYRIDQVEQGAQQLIEAVRIESDVYKPATFPDIPVTLRPFTPAVPVLPLFMDLPLIGGDEVPHAPYLALTADPWPGSVAVYDAPSDEDYALNEIIAARSVVGVTQTPLFAAPSGRVDRGQAVQVQLTSGALASISDTALLAGGNLLAIGDGSPDRWELMQVRDAELVGKRQYMLSHRLRGQQGSDGVMPDVWPEGSYIVAMNGIPGQITLAPANRGLARHFRIGPARRSYDDPSYVYRVHAFDGNGLRPYSVAHLRASGGADVALNWVRRTREGGDSWLVAEVPLSEETEAYRVRVWQGPTLIREAVVGTPAWVYTAAMRGDDALTGGCEIGVAQVSASYGDGPEVRVALG